MKVAILGGGIAGLAAAYELEQQRKAGAAIDWTLYEASDRFGGIIETTLHCGFTIEGGPDAWVTEKPWARDLAIELGLESQLISSNDATRKTYILKKSGDAGEIANKLQPMPDRMRMMVPEDLATLENSPLFSATARAAYADELQRADDLRATSPSEDESVATFVRRHFGDEVLEKIGAPLLSGVFGGDVEKLSVRAVMPAFVAMEQEHGSLIAAVQAKIKWRGDKPALPVFTSLRDGMGTLVEALIAKLPPERLHINRSALSLKRERNSWCVRTSKHNSGKSKKHFNHVLIATPIDTARTLLQPLDAQAAALIPTDASSAVLTTFCWPAQSARTFALPPGFGFLAPQKPAEPLALDPEPSLLACTFVDQKFPHRAPAGARIIRVFFGGSSFDAFAEKADDAVAAIAFSQLEKILGPLPPPEPALTTVRRWPRSLPQYELGHLDSISALDARIAALGGLTLLGNGYRGVGLPDLIRDARNAARNITAQG